MAEAYRDRTTVETEHEGHIKRFESRSSAPKTAHATGQAIGRLLFMPSEGYRRDTISALAEMALPVQLPFTTESMRPPEQIAEQHAGHMQLFEAKRNEPVPIA